MARGALFANTQNNSNVSNMPGKGKSDAFINLYLPRASGGRVQIGFIGLNKDTELGNALMERLGEEGGAERLLAALQIEYREIVPVTKGDLAF